MIRIERQTHDERHLRILIEQMVSEGQPEHAIVAAVRRAQEDRGVVLHGRRRSFFR
jgi:hypothetical protein